MKSYEVIRESLQEPGVKALAAALRVSPALVYKWCEPPADGEDPDQSGAKNPLDRVRDMYMLTKDIRLIRWLCNQAGGFFVADPVPHPTHSPQRSVIDQTRLMMREFSEMLDTVTEAVEDDQYIDVDEATAIRQRWEDLKSAAEFFTLSCEKGHFRLKPPPRPNQK